MAIERLAPNIIWTDQPIDFAREAVWHALNRNKIWGAVIDVNREIVSGFFGNNISSYGHRIVAVFAPHQGGTSITVESKPTSWGFIDAGSSKKRARFLGNAIENALREEREVLGPIESVILPIADPFADHSKLNATPRYGPAMPFPMGASLLMQAALSLVCCKILSPFVWLAANRAFRDYGDVDPGDRGMIRIARVLGIIGSIVLAIPICMILFSLVVDA